MITEKKKQDKQPKEKKTTETEKFDMQFKNMIKSIIAEEGYFRERDLKDLMESILQEIEPIIAKHIKQHFSEIGQYMVKITNVTNVTNIDRKDDNA